MLLEIDQSQYGFIWNRYCGLPAINCKQILYSVNVSADGVAGVCNGIRCEIGDLYHQSLSEVLRSRVARKMRAVYEYMERPVDLALADCYGCRARAHNLVGDMFAADPIWQPGRAAASGDMCVGVEKPVETTTGQGDAAGRSVSIQRCEGT